MVIVHSGDSALGNSGFVDILSAGSVSLVAKQSFTSAGNIFASAGKTIQSTGGNVRLASSGSINVMSKHCLQDDLPVSSLYIPGTHDLHIVLLDSSFW